MKTSIFKKVQRLIADSTMRTKLILIFVVLLLLPSCVFTVYASGRIKVVVREQTFSAARKTFEETVSAIQTRVEKVTAVLELLVYDNQLYNIASTQARNYPYALQWEDQRALSASFHQLKMLSEVSGIRLYVQNDYLYSNENQHIFPMRSILNTSWCQSLMGSSSHLWFTPLDFSNADSVEEDVFSCMRLLYNPDALLSPLAILRIDIDAASLDKAISYSSTPQNGMVLLLDDGKLALLGSSNGEADVLSERVCASLAQLASDEWLPIQISGTDYYAYSTALQPAPWQLVTLIPFSDISSVSTKLQWELLLVMFLVATVAFFIAILLSNRLLRRIWQLTDTMQTVESGNVKVQLQDDSKDEIGQLIAHFNRMMNRIQQLLDEKLVYGIEIKNLELKALQAQINPHFLYNTLDTINCLALQENVPEISELVAALAAFYRISLSRGQDTIPICDEVRHAQMYLRIQGSRFENQICERWDISPAIEDCLIIKIVLQPIIENALIHGIFERDDSCGHIFVRGWRDDQDIYITVTDDGVGMPPDVIAENFEKNTDEISHTKGGYGIRNINDRLKIAYGPEYGLSCESTLGVGTVVTIHIPAQHTTLPQEDEPITRGSIAQGSS